jgi:23S rRNA (cytidine1920-2'-O)/16S rRNA (cytidine1409-2'-O)-methyltransferase
VGIGQFHESLRIDKRINLYESTDVRNFSSLRRYDIVVADLSFISLEPLFDIIANFSKESTEFFLLIKPQFEVGKGNTKKGIVKDPALVSEVLRKYEVLAKMHSWSDVQLLPCHIQGGDGNQEYFLYGKTN